MLYGKGIHVRSLKITAILEPPFSIFKIWQRIRIQHPRKFPFINFHKNWEFFEISFRHFEFRNTFSAFEISEKKSVGKEKKKCWKKNLGKINYKTKIFIIKIYSNIDKCHTIFALLAPFDRTGRRTGRNENECGIWFKVGSVARSH